MKKLCVLGGALLLLAFASGCEVRPYGGASVGVYGEYPATYSGGYYSAPAYPVYPSYPYYGHGYYRGYYDRDHWYGGRRLEGHGRYERHESHDGRRDRDDRH